MTSIRRHLTLGLLTTTALLMTVSGALVWLLVRESLFRQFDSSLRSRAAHLHGIIEEEDGMLEVELRLEPLAPAGEGVVPTLFQVWSAQGESVLKAESLGPHSLPRLAPPASAEFSALSTQRLPDGTRIRALATRFDARDDKRGLFRNLTLVTARSTESIDSTLRLLFWILAGTGVSSLILMAPLIRWVLARGLSPLGELAARTAAIDVPHLHQRLPEENAPVELAPVIARLNELLARLENSFERERRFSSDVAHELRTPVAELQALGELAVTWPDQATPAAFEQVVAITREMEALISRLTLLAKADSGEPIVSLEETEVEVLMSEVIGRYAGQAEQRRLIIRAQLAPVRRRTDPALLKVIISNLIGNAVHHAPTGSRVEVKLEPEMLAVRNEAPGLQAEDVTRLFDRFWRKDAARSGYGHSGLGLPLAQSLAGLLGGELSGSLSDASILELRYHFPQS